MKSIHNHYRKLFENDFKSTFQLLFQAGKFCGLHNFKLTARQPKYIRCRLSDIFLIILFISLNLYALHQHIKINLKNKMFQSLIVDYGTKMFITTGIIFNIFTMLRDSYNQNYLLSIVNSIGHFDKQVILVMNRI